ncbi:MAG TPA: hypothetical protein VMY35_07550 [Phycisphaerae bacterium]|nr:hypothetical protein [Phycisphaerae bacterium]
MEKRGLVNAYQCRVCAEVVMTITMNTGTTPASMRCSCREGAMKWSCWYRISGHFDLLPVTHAWYRPRSGDGLDPPTLDHLQHGGLILAPLAEAAREALTGIEPTGDEWVDWRPWLEARYGKAD